MELSKLQENILKAPHDKIVVISSAASGKTLLMTEKVRRVLRAGVDPHQIAVITFTNMAASELRQRLGTDYKDGLFVGTVHALANYFLLSAGINTNKLLDNEDFDGLFEMVEDNPGCVKHLEWVLLDEGQDSDELQFRFLFDMINPDKFFVCADPKQSIYQWKGSNPNLVKELGANPQVEVYNLNENYRNGFNILNYAKNLIRPTGMIDTSIAMKKGNGAVAELPYSPFIAVQKIREKPNFGSWAILCRTNSEIATISEELRVHNIPFDTFRQGDLSKEELVTKMAQDTVKILTVHSAKGLEWDNVMVLGMRYTTNEERNICYVAATRARENLIWLHYVTKRKPQNKIKTYEW